MQRESKPMAPGAPAPQKPKVIVEKYQKAGATNEYKEKQAHFK